MKASGIYQIKNIINNKVYIGHSENMAWRWYNHLNGLYSGEHPNPIMAEDYNKYGLTAFKFEVLEEVKGKGNLLRKERDYLAQVADDLCYNINTPAWHQSMRDIEEFIKYINNNWLVPKDCANSKPYRIYGEDRQKILDEAIKYQILDVPLRCNTFNRTIRFMQDTLGYVVETGKFMLERKRYTYKLVIDYDDEFVAKGDEK